MEYDFRPTCPTCNGEKGYRAPSPPNDGRAWDYIPDFGFIVACWQCKGEGKVPLESDYELEYTEPAKE